MAFGDRRTPLKRTGFKKTGRSPLPQRSKKRAAHMREERAPEVKRLIEAGVTCKVCPILQSIGVKTCCQVQIGGLHERRKSGSGGSRSNPENTVPSCNWANGYLEDAVGRDRELIEACSALVVREGNHLWDSLGERAWRER